eukprot:Gb_04719 [translate_table: standard]
MMKLDLAQAATCQFQEMVRHLKSQQGEKHQEQNWGLLQVSPQAVTECLYNGEELHPFCVSKDQHLVLNETYGVKAWPDA